MGWDKKSIAAMRKPIVEERFADASREELLAHIVKLEADLYPFVYVLGAIDTEQWKGTTVTSKIFPQLSKDDDFQVYDEEARDFGTIEDIPEKELHDIDYEEVDSIVIYDGTALDDTFSLLHVHQEGPGHYVSCGEISMADVRQAKETLYPKKVEDPEP